MTSLEEILGFDPNAPDARRAQLLASNDRAFLRELIAIRKERDISQAAVGEMMGVSQPTVAAFESHESNPKLSTIRRYAHAVGALVRHTVALDEGQLEEADGADVWRTARLDARVKASSAKEAMPPFHLLVTSETGGRSTNADFALAA